jgi:hypothetical protein
MIDWLYRSQGRVRIVVVDRSLRGHILLLDSMDFITAASGSGMTSSVLFVAPLSRLHAFTPSPLSVWQVLACKRCAPTTLFPSAASLNAHQSLLDQPYTRLFGTPIFSSSSHKHARQSSRRHASLSSINGRQTLRRLGSDLGPRRCRRSLATRGCHCHRLGLLPPHEKHRSLAASAEEGRRCR